MNEAVLDASVVLRWAFDDEADREGALHVAARLADGTLRAVAPPTFLAEVAGVLVRAIRAGRLPRIAADAVMAELVKVAIDEVEPHGLAVAAMKHALGHGLHVPDATYLETARRTGAPLITADRAQLQAATDMGLATLALSEVPAQEA
jgi:predicted nucleic acid-binding protein